MNIRIIVFQDVGLPLNGKVLQLSIQADLSSLKYTIAANKSNLIII